MSKNYSEDYTELKGESELFDLWLRTQEAAIALADQLKLTDEELKLIEARWMAEDLAPDRAMAKLARYVLTIRQFRGLIQFVKSDETLVAVAELVARANIEGTE